MAEVTRAEPHDLPVGPIGRHGVGWWGVGTLVASEAALFAYLLFAYFYTGATAPPDWLLEPRPVLKLALPNTILLLASSGAAWFGEQGILKQRRSQALLGFGGAFLMGTAFVIVQWFEWHAKAYGLGASSYASLYFVTTGFHIAHVVVGHSRCWRRSSPGRPWITSARGGGSVVSAGVVYWHFVDIVWLFVFTTYYVTPYLGFGK
jgi:cytochrome c oxidase subunit 3